LGVLGVKCTLKNNDGIFSGPLEGHDKPKLEVFVGKHTDGKYCSWWEIEEHIDGTRSHICFASGVLHPTPEGYAGEIVSVRGRKVRGWRAVAKRGSATINFEAI